MNQVLAASPDKLKQMNADLRSSLHAAQKENGRISKKLARRGLDLDYPKRTEEEFLTWAAEELPFGISTEEAEAVLAFVYGKDGE